jgi:hypothetical protein
VTSTQTSSSSNDLERLAEQHGELARMLASQEASLAEMQKNLAAGLVHRAEVVREETALGELKVALLQNQRDQAKGEAELQTASLAEQAMQRSRQHHKMLTPEMLAQRDQAVHLDLEVLKLGSERREKEVQIRADQVALAKADELLAQMKGRPIFRAVESSQNVAFVPYTQLKGVRAGAPVFICETWGVFQCRPVGTVSEVLPGEVATQDPWGTPARGQYALLALDDPAAAQAKTLRVRETARSSR